MRFAEAWRVALDALRANRLRSGLTMLGVGIGGASVGGVVAGGTGGKVEGEAPGGGLGSHLRLVVPGRVQVGGAPTGSRLQLSDVDAVTRVVGDRSRIAATVQSGETVRAGTRERFTSVLGVLETTPQVFVRSIARGSYLSRSDVD